MEICFVACRVPPIFHEIPFNSCGEKRGRMGRLEGIESLLEIGQQAFIYTVFCLFMDMTDIIIVIDIK